LPRCSQERTRQETAWVPGTSAFPRHDTDLAGIAYLGRADIGHDIDNKVVPFGDGYAA